MCSALDRLVGRGRSGRVLRGIGLFIRFGSASRRLSARAAVGPERPSCRRIRRLRCLRFGRRGRRRRRRRRASAAGPARAVAEGVQAAALDRAWAARASGFRPPRRASGFAAGLPSSPGMECTTSTLIGSAGAVRSCTMERQTATKATARIRCTASDRIVLGTTRFQRADRDSPSRRNEHASGAPSTGGADASPTWRRSSLVAWKSPVSIRLTDRTKSDRE